MDRVTKALVERQREIAARQGPAVARSAEVLGAVLLDYYGGCPHCREPLEFEPRVAVRLVENAEHFIHLYGITLAKHYGEEGSRDCEEQVRGMCDPEQLRGAKR